MNLYKELLEKQKNEIRIKGILPISFRIHQLKILKETIKKYEEDLIKALALDLGKSPFEAYSTEIGFVYNSIDHIIKHIKKWAKPKTVKNDLGQIPGTSMIYKAPYGCVLIIGPYNYPFQLLIEPLLGAIAAGNRVVLKPSEFTPHIEKFLVKIITEIFPEDYVAIVTGDYHVNNALLDLPFDYIFFTGSVRVGKIVMEKASKHLIPITLELGGKSPVIVDATANIQLAAKRIIWGKLMNAGQTCVAPDYVLAHENILEPLSKAFQSTIKEFYGENIQSNPDFGRIVNEKHMLRLKEILDKDRNKIIFGGHIDLEDRYIEPTLLSPVTLEDQVMADEIFGPILPILSYRTFEDLQKIIESHPNPLALYVFSEDPRFSEKVIQDFSFGGGCVNDTILHVASKYLPFGGVGSSGIGRYHGQSSFHAFTYEKAIVKRSTRINIPLVFPPYKNKLDLIKKLMK